MNFLSVFLLLIKLLLFVIHITADGCSISLTSLPKKEPVLLISPPGSTPPIYALFKPSGETSTLSVGTKLILVCSGYRNAIQLLRQQSLELNCQSGNIFKTTVGNEQYSLSNLGCRSIPTSDLQLTSTKCAQDNGYIFKAGFTFNTNNFASLFSICYNNVTENTFYTYNTINGAAIDFAISENTRRAFRGDGMKFTTTAINSFYKINNQITRFENFFGAQQKYSDTYMYLARGHLTPDADFVMRYEQLATYFYANVAPEFQIINSGNWLRIENLARRLASQYESELDIYNGYIGQLQLTHPTTNALVSIILEKTQQIRAPKYYFKVIKHVPTNAAIVMITLNNPFARAANTQEFCRNVCDEAGFDSEIFADTSRGYTFCCELDDFKQHYTFLPNDLTANKLLNDSNNRNG